MEKISVFSSSNYVEVYANEVDVIVENKRVKVYYCDGIVEINLQDKQISIRNINRKE